MYSKAIRFQKWSLIAVFLHLLTVFYPLSDSSNAEYLLWNGNRVQIKGERFERFVDILSAI